MKNTWLLYSCVLLCSIIGYAQQDSLIITPKLKNYDVANGQYQLLVQPISTPQYINVEAGDVEVPDLFAAYTNPYYAHYYYKGYFIITDGKLLQEVKDRWVTVTPVKELEVITIRMCGSDYLVSVLKNKEPVETFEVLTGSCNQEFALNDSYWCDIELMDNVQSMGKEFAYGKYIVNTKKVADSIWKAIHKKPVLKATMDSMPPYFMAQIDLERLDNKGFGLPKRLRETGLFVSHYRPRVPDEIFSRRGSVGIKKMEEYEKIKTFTNVKIINEAWYREDYCYIIEYFEYVD